MRRRLTDEDINDIFAEAAHCGFFMKDGPRGWGRRWTAWREGYLQALRDVQVRTNVNRTITIDRIGSVSLEAIVEIADVLRRHSRKTDAKDD